MYFRVAEFQRVGRRRVFAGFAEKGYFLTAAGELRHRRKKISQRDKRRRGYVELNMATGQSDMNGAPLFENDVCRVCLGSGRATETVIRFKDNVAAFIAVAERGRLKIPFAFLDKTDAAFWKIGTIYDKMI